MIEYKVVWADFPISDVYVSSHELLENAVGCARKLQRKAKPYRNYYIVEYNDGVAAIHRSRDGDFLYDI